MVILALVLGGLYIFLFRGSLGSSNTDARFVSTGISLRYEYSPNLNTFTTPNGFFFGSKDGIRFITTRGETRFNMPLNMREPVFKSFGDFVGLAENGGRIFYLFNENGLVFSQTYEEPNSGIINFSVNEAGYTSVIVRMGDNYRIFVYNASGQSPLTVTYQDRNTIPVASAVSIDGQILAISSVDFGGINLEPEIRFYYTREALAGSLTDGIFGAISGVSGEIIARLEFLGGNHLVAISGHRLSVIETGGNNLIRPVFEYEFNNHVSHIAFPDNNSIAVALGQNFLNQNSPHNEGTVLFFDIRQGLTNYYETNSPISFLAGGLGCAIIAHGNLGRNVTAVDLRGRSLWDYVVTQDIKDMQFLTRTSRVVFVFALSLDVMEIE